MLVCLISLNYMLKRYLIFNQLLNLNSYCSKRWWEIHFSLQKSVFLQQARKNKIRCGEWMLQLRNEASDHWVRKWIKMPCRCKQRLLHILKNQNLKLNRKFSVEIASKDNKYWTSGSNAGAGCEETWGWCNSKALFKTPFTMWKVGAPGAPRRQRCAQLHLQPNISLVGLEDVTCTTEQFFICKVFALSNIYIFKFCFII